MVAAPGRDRRGAASLRDYLKSCGGRDILVYGDEKEANNAAHAIHAREDEVFIRACSSFDKVFLQLKGIH